MVGSPVSNPDMKSLLQSHFGFSAFRDGQQAVVETLLAGSSAAAVFPTGGGKSLCYQLPALLLPGITLVVSPLIALMKDQMDALDRRGVAAVRLDSSLSAHELSAATKRLRLGEVKILYVSPERFKNERFRELLGQLNISLFAVDEAHCISEWGHNFRPDYLKLTHYADACGAERTLALTATATPAVLRDICREFRIAEEHAFRTGFCRPNLELCLTRVSLESREAELLSRLRSRPPGATVIYVTQQKTAETVAQWLLRQGLDAKAYHAGLEPDWRAQVQEWFCRSTTAIIVATIAFGMGIDKPDIRYVYHYNLPKSLENYSQEVGRAGRDGLPATCELLACRADLRVLENFIYGDTPQPVAVSRLIQFLFRRSSPYSLSYYAAAQKFDIREMVLRTLITYLELDGYLEIGTPYYQEYQFTPLQPSGKILERFDGSRQEFLKAIFRLAKKRQRWCVIDMDEAAKATGADRQRVVRALDFLAERGWIQMKNAGLVQPVTIQRPPHDLTALSESLMLRLMRREERERNRLQMVLDLIDHRGCQAAKLADYFGELDSPACGQCSWCQQQTVAAWPEDRDRRELDETKILAEWQGLRRQYPQLFHEPRVMACFFCGISSPSLTRLKLTKHPAFGRWEDLPFEGVLNVMKNAVD